MSDPSGNFEAASALRRSAMDMMNRGDFSSALVLFLRLIESGSGANDYYPLYGAGQCYRFSGMFPEAVGMLTKAANIAPEGALGSVLRALGIARQKVGDLDGAIETLREAHRAEPESVEVFISFGMTRKLMGDYENAILNYDSGLKTLSRRIVGLLSDANSASSARPPHWDSRNSIWTKYAFDAAIELCAANETVEGFAWPTGAMASEDQRTGFLEGWYWRDSPEPSGKFTRMFCPNFFSTFASQLREDSRYPILVGNISTSLRLLGRDDDSEHHREEAEDFGHDSVPFLSDDGRKQNG